MNKSKLSDKIRGNIADSLLNYGNLCVEISQGIKDRGEDYKEVEKLIISIEDLVFNNKTQRKAILEEVRSILPKEIENHYGMISPDVGYNQAIKEMRQKLSLLEGEK